MANISTTGTFTVKMSPGTLARLSLWACRSQLERLAEIERLLAGDLSGRDAVVEVCMQLAQFGDYQEGEPLPNYLTSLPAAQAYARRVMPGAKLGMLGTRAVLVTPPDDERLTAEERSAMWAQRVEPHPVAHPEAFALLRVIVRLMTAIVRADLATAEAEIAEEEISEMVDEVAAAAVSPPARASSLPAVGSFG